MPPRKGFSTFSLDISEELSNQSYWHMLTTEICGITPLQYLKQSPIVTTFFEDFCRIESGKLWLLVGHLFINKKNPVHIRLFWGKKQVLKNKDLLRLIKLKNFWTARISVPLKETATMWIASDHMQLRPLQCPHERNACLGSFDSSKQWQS